MTMHISIKNEAQERVASIQHWERDLRAGVNEPYSLQSVDQLLPGEEKVVYIHSTKYVTIQECEHKEG